MSIFDTLNIKQKLKHLNLDMILPIRFEFINTCGMAKKYQTFIHFFLTDCEALSIVKRIRSEMNSLVLSILIISSVFRLGYGLEFPSHNDNHIQKTERLSTLPEIEATVNKDLKELNINDWHQIQEPLDYVFEVSLSATQWDWQIRKIGTFCSEVLICKVKSPHDILVDFNGFTNLINIETHTQINTSYAISQLVPPPPNSTLWIPANNLNSADFIVPRRQEMTWNLWSRLDITNQVSALEFENRPTITFAISGVIDWIEPDLALKRRLDTYSKKQSENR